MPYIPNSERTEEELVKLREQRRRYQIKFRTKNPEYAKERTRVWRERHPERVKESNRRQNVRRYGLTLEQYDAMVTAQNACCAVCGNEQDSRRSRRLYIDHCHTTGKVRGLLCANCNALLGLAKESITILTAAMAYLREHN